MPGIIVSRPIFNTLFKLAHEEGLSINAFLTRLLDSAGPDAVTQVAAASRQNGATATADRAVQEAPAGTEIAGSERSADEVNGHAPAQQATLARPSAGQGAVRPIEFDDDPGPEPGPGEIHGAGGRAPGHSTGNTTWDRVVSMEGRRLATSRGKKFSYRVTGEYIVVRDSQARIPRSQFDKAQKMWPVSGPSRLVGVYAPSVVWAIMKELNEIEAAAAV